MLSDLVTYLVAADLQDMPHIPQSNVCKPNVLNCIKWPVCREFNFIAMGITTLVVKMTNQASKRFIDTEFSFP